MKKTLYGTLYLIVFSYIAIIASELSQGIVFNGIQKKLGFLPFVDVLTKDNLTGIVNIINGANLVDYTSLKILAVGVLISFTVGLLICKYLVFPQDRELKS